MAPTEGRVARPERRWGCRRGTPNKHQCPPHYHTTEPQSALGNISLVINNVILASQIMKISQPSLHYSNLFVPDLHYKQEPVNLSSNGGHINTSFYNL